MHDPGDASSKRQALISGGVAVLSVAAVFELLLAPFAAVAVLIAFLAASRQPPRLRRLHYYLLGAAALVTAFTFVRFLAVEALSGIVQGGTRAAEQTIVSRLRELLFAEDSLRKQAEIDPDADGIGSAALIPELTAELGLRQGMRLTPPLLERFGKSEGTAIGPANLLGGYWVIVCLPKKGGGFSADPKDPVDEEAAERRFLAYAWPSSPGLGLAHAYFLDEHERILMADTGPERRMGHNRPPACDDAVAEATRGDWRPWRDKKPRSSLPGDGTGR